MVGPGRQLASLRQCSRAVFPNLLLASAPFSDKQISVTKRALWSSSLPMPRSTADENSNHNHFIIEEDSFAVQLTFSGGNCSSSIYLLAFHLCFVSKTLSFCLQITCIHLC